jgi:hypothetical protein
LAAGGTVSARPASPHTPADGVASAGRRVVHEHDRDSGKVLYEKKKTVTFHANCVAVDHMEDFWLVGFADEKFDTRQYLMLQRSFEDDEQDIRLGQNTYHVERNDQAWSCYGGIERFELHRDRVSVTFTERGAARLAAPAMEICFQIDDRQFSELRKRLGFIFEGTECLVIS